MKNFNTLSALLMLIALSMGCKKNEQDKAYKDVNRIGIAGDPLEYATADSILFSFAVYPAGTSEANVSVIGTVMGAVATTDREFKLEIDAAKTTALPAEYVLPASFIVKAGSATARIPVTLKRSARIQNASIKLALKVAGNTNFEPAPKSTFSMVWTDELTKPTNWDGANSVGFYFGKYSKVKHRLIVDATEYKNLAVLSGNYNALFYIASRALEDLTTYNAAHPGNPLKSEGGITIGICSSCD
ncbi:DUF4843 domain-containing protein [Pedobacter sp. GR22-6]|uniref:DUF4843 domain-containing protein n=1 Tax=Pedobacter sp. GR22-6 TaxID=3127957 RepID=UPI00307D5A84